MNSIRISAVAITAAGLFLSACQSAPFMNRDNSAGRPTVYQDVRSADKKVQGVGIQSNDIAAMTDKMMRDMLANPMLAGRMPPPRIIVDSEYFTNESSTRVDKNLITNRLRVDLTRAANGRMIFVARNRSNMVAKERELKRDGQVDGGTIRTTRAQAGADYRLAGSINSLDALDPSTGTMQRYQQITFEMIDLELGTIVWSGIYEFEKTGQNDIIYR